MSLDKIFFYIRNGKQEQVFNKRVSSEDLIKKRFSYKKNSKELFIIIPPWGGGMHLNVFLRKSLFKKGHSFLEYEFPEEILSSNWKFTLSHFNKIKDLILEDIKILNKKYKFKKITLIGISLGGVLSCKIANNNPLINELDLIVPGHCLAEAMWKGISTQNLRKSYESQGINLRELKNYWKSLAPENNISQLKAKKINLFLSKSDLVIPFYCGNRLLTKIKSLNYNLSYKINNSLGHYFTIFSFYLDPKKFIACK
jgi:hypothetical protein